MPKRASFSAVSFPKKPDDQVFSDDVEEEKPSEKVKNPFVVEVEESGKPVMHTVEEDTDNTPQQEEEKSISAAPPEEETPEVPEEESRQEEEREEVRNDISVTRQEEPVSQESPKLTKEHIAIEEDIPLHKPNAEVSDLFKKSQDFQPVQEEFAKYPEITISEKDGLKPIVFWAIALVVAVCIIGAALLAMKRGTIGQGVVPFLPRPTPTAIPTPTVAVTPTPTLPPIVKKDIKIKVLNGSGVTGAAKTLKTSLEEKGYTVPTATNADSSSYEKTQIRVKAGKEYLIQLLTTELKGTYTVGESKSDLPKTSNVDAEITIGKS